MTVASKDLRDEEIDLAVTCNAETVLYLHSHTAEILLGWDISFGKHCYAAYASQGWPALGSLRYATCLLRLLTPSITLFERPNRLLPFVDVNREDKKTQLEGCNFRLTAIRMPSPEASFQRMYVKSFAILVSLGKVLTELFLSARPSSTLLICLLGRGILSILR